MRHLSLLLGALLLLAGAVAGAEQAAAPITVEADQLELNQATGISIYRGNVELQQQEMQLTAERLELHSRDGQLYEAYADGKPVKMHQTDPETGELTRAQAEHMEYRFADNILELKGEAHLWRGGDQFSGKHLIYNSAERTVRAYGDKQGQEAGRVRVILQPATESGDE